jgi:hypothetical protein
VSQPQRLSSSTRPHGVARSAAAIAARTVTGRDTPRGGARPARHSPTDRPARRGGDSALNVVAVSPRSAGSSSSVEGRTMTNARTRQASRSPLLFISHRHADRDIANQLRTFVTDRSGGRVRDRAGSGRQRLEVPAVRLAADGQRGRCRQRPLPTDPQPGSQPASAALPPVQRVLQQVRHRPTGCCADRLCRRAAGACRDPARLRPPQLANLTRARRRTDSQLVAPFRRKRHSPRRRVRAAPADTS